MFTTETVIRNRYRIIRAAESALGESYDAYDETQERPVTVQAWDIANESALERIRHAAVSRSKNHHPALSEIIDHFAEDDRYIVVSERFEGATLSQRLQAQGAPFAPETVLRWGDSLLDAIIALHRQSPSLSHGSISADNLRETGEGGLSLAGVDLYTVGGTNAPIEAEDVYDVAAVLYYLLTGVKPPTMQGRAERGFLPPADILNPEVPSGFSQVLAQGLSDNPDSRFRSAFALQNALRRVQGSLNETPTIVSSPTVPSLAEKLQQRQEAPTTHPPHGDSRVESGEGREGTTTYPSHGDSRADPSPLSPDPSSSFDPQPIAAEAQAMEPTPNERPAPDPYKISFGEPAGTTPSEPYRSEMPPPSTPTPPSNKNRVWMAVGLGCLGALLCICCGLAGFAYYQGSSFLTELEAVGIPVDGEEPRLEPTAERSRNEVEEEATVEPDGNDVEEGPAIGNNPDDSNGVTVSVFELSSGDCFNDPLESDTVQELTLIDCDVLHDNEVFALGDYPAGASEEFPTPSDLDDFSDTFCRGEFETYVGMAYDDSIYYIYYLQPTENSWEDGDREIVCILYDQDEQIEGSKEGSRE